MLRGAARASYDLMSSVERASIDRGIARLERDANPDGATTYAVPDAPHLFLYDDGTWQMRYTVPDDATVVILGIDHALDLPN